MSKQFVVIGLENQRYCMPIELVSGVIDNFSITNIPNSLDFVEGVSNIRGEVLPVVNLKKLFRISDSQEFEDKLMTVSIQGKSIGIVVDSASNVITVDDEYIDTIPPVLGKGKQFFNMVANIEDSLALVIDPLGLFDEYERKELFSLSEK